MGFKDLVLRLNHLEVYEILNKFRHYKNFNESIEWGGYEDKLVTTTTYSDSIIIYSKDDSFASLEAFSCTISGLIEDLFFQNIPFKGAVAFGPMTLDTQRSIFFGQPLIDSYLLQEELNFYGIIVHATAEKEISQHAQKIRTLFLMKYLCPLKGGSSYHLTIYPMCIDPFDDAKVTEEDYNKLFNSVDNFRHMTSGHLRKYIDNTEVYLKYVRENLKI